MFSTEKFVGKLIRPGRQVVDLPGVLFSEGVAALLLSTNAVIFYNTALLSKVYEQKLAAGDQAAINALRGISPVAWQHVNLFGNFEFSDAQTKVDRKRSINHALARGAGADARRAVYGPPSSMFQGSSAS